MTRQMWKAAAALALVAGCGSPAVRGVEEVEVGTGQALTVDLRVRAKGAESFQNLFVLADDVRVLADGVPVPVELTDDVVDLAQMEHAAKVASAQIPEGTRQVEFVVHVAPAGLWAQSSTDGWVDAPSSTVRFTSPVENLVQNGKAVMVLDAAKSFVARDAETFTLVPKFGVAY